ncbi:hypothetical protein G6F65_012686 [Rhizopus arrhizus]|nr:hypothetical protein G6F65_012686 [Rhizopus arrhizus]
MGGGHPGPDALVLRRRAIRQYGHAGSQHDHAVRAGRRRYGIAARSRAAVPRHVDRHWRAGGAGGVGQGADRPGVAWRHRAGLAAVAAGLAGHARLAVGAGLAGVRVGGGAVVLVDAGEVSRLLSLLLRLSALRALRAKRLQQRAAVLVLCPHRGRAVAAVVDLGRVALYAGILA